MTLKKLAVYSLVPALSILLAAGARAELSVDAERLIAQADVDGTYIPETAYDEYMRLGFESAQDGDYAIAANYFRYALFAVPNDQEATTAYWNARAQLQTGELSGKAQLYNDNMEAGYDATEEEDYRVAIGYFQTALNLRPGDYYATQAMRNVQTYLECISVLHPCL